MWILNLIGWLADLCFPQRQPPPGPALSPETQRRLRILFPEPDWVAAEELLFSQCGNNLPGLDQLNAVELERFRFAALKLSDGSLDKLGGAVVLARSDWRDLLMAAGFGDLDTHRHWEPKPAGAPDEIEPLGLSPRLHEQLRTLLFPLGFARSGDVWRRHCLGGLTQIVTLHPGLRDREHATYFVEIEFLAKPTPVVVRLPRLPGPDGQGYRFHSNQDPAAEIARIATDLAPVIAWLQRFGSHAEVQRGFADGAFDRHLMSEGKAFLT